MDLIERYNPSKNVLLYEHRIISPGLSEELKYLVILLDLKSVELIPMQDMMYHGLKLLRQLLHPCNHYIHNTALLVVTIYFPRQSFIHNMRRYGGQQDERRMMDEEYLKLREEIGGSRLTLRVAPYHKMHISEWLRKMDQGVESDGMRRIRNNYAKLLNLMCECEVLVVPFDRPPEGNLTKLSKQRINQIIDEVEEAVKQGQEVQGVNESREAFNQVGVPSSSVLASEAEEVVEDEEEHSQVIGRFVNESVKRTQDYSGTYFSVMQESRESETSEEKKNFFSDMKPGSVDLFPVAMDCNMRQERKARHIKVEINTFHTKMPASPAFEKIGESKRNSQFSPSFSDISQQLCESQRSFHKNIDLSKEAISHKYALYQTNCQEIEEILSEDPDFSSQLSQRCMQKDHPRNSQIAWAFKKENTASEANFHKQKLTLTESIPSKGLFRTSTFNSKNSSLVKEAQRLKSDPDESFTSKPSLASQLRDYESSPLRDLTNFSFLAI